MYCQLIGESLFHLSYPTNLIGVLMSKTMRGTNKSAFTPTGVISLSDSSPAASARSYAEVSALDGAQVIDLRNEPACIVELLLAGDLEDDSVIQEIWASRGEGHMVLVATITWTVGAQSAPAVGYSFADAVSVVMAEWYKTFSSRSPGSDGVAGVLLDLMEYGLVVIVTTTLTTDKNAINYYAPIFLA